MNTIKHYTLATLVFLATCGAPLLGACSTLADVVWPQAVTCGSEVADDLFPAVSVILLQDRGSETMSAGAASKLEDMAREHTPKVVACLVEGILKNWVHPGAAQTPDRVAAVKRARGWQADVGTVVEAPE